jgi:glycogenin glucosyltransferase
VLKNSDELFEREELSAAPDPGWPDCFNSGVFVYRPSLDTFNALIKFALSKGSFDGKFIDSFLVH